MLIWSNISDIKNLHPIKYMYHSMFMNVLLLQNAWMGSMVPVVRVSVDIVII